ncbi:MAG: HD domain-containing protein [Vampirovibrionales bacterium]
MVAPSSLLHTNALKHYTTPVLSQAWQEAFTWASTLHATQVRKGFPVPYISHLMAVASIVLEFGGTESAAIAALLHDAVEDQGGLLTAERIRHHFGEMVYSLVMACTDLSFDPETQKPLELPWLSQKQAFIERVAQPHYPPEAVLIIAADKLHNLRSVYRDYQHLGEATWHTFRGGREGTLYYYEHLVHALNQHYHQVPFLTQRLLEELMGFWVDVHHQVTAQ